MLKQKRVNNISPVQPTGDYDIYHIGVLDGVRAVAILLVAWYHIWQQSWLMPITEHVNLDWLVRNGGIMVDMMILLSGFCLFLPHARNMVLGETLGGCKEFYIKRVARIAPSYYVAVLVCLLCFALPAQEYAGNTGFMMTDIFSHMTFTHNLFGDVIQGTHLNGVLWTVAVEVQFYLVFPLLARWFRKNPIITYMGMVAVGIISSFVISGHWETINQALYVNSTLTFFSVYANGMLGAWLYVLYANKRKKKSWPEGVAGIVLTIGGIVAYRYLCDWRMNYGEGLEQRWQVDMRYLLSFVFLAIVFGQMLSMKWFQKIWDNRVMAFLAGISFNFYICHQYLAVKLKEFRIPGWEGEELPNFTGDVAWQWKYTILCFTLSLVIATILTYGVEKPVAKWILKRWGKQK